ncbi:hypothetical protein [Maritalea sp.]|jgi:hypothetical protein|uniref:hypothetical protein n=1 Tax=Maritalea sp. TaxID=2003361 RepID=UPI0039E23D97
MNTAQSSYNDFVESMFYVLYKQLDQVESRISSDGPVDAVALGNIAKTFEKLIELREAGKAPNKTRIESTAASALREMLSKNLERLNEQD